jgi:hypothetical protein
MYETYRNQDALKRNAGVSARGRKNTAPVLHYTLAWHSDDAPTPEQMKAAAISSLKALGLQEHEALIAGHTDKQHPHVHIVVNTVHPYTGRTAALKFTKERLSEWAQEIEQEIGRVHCEERLRNNEERKRVRRMRQHERLARHFEPAAAPTPAPYVPIKHKAVSRSDWLDRKEIVARMQQLRSQLNLQHSIARGLAWEGQRRERDELDRNTQAAIDHAREAVSTKFRPQWRELYRAQGQELRTIERTATHPFERAVLVFRNRERLGNGKPLTFRRMVGLILSEKKLRQTIQAVHERERRSLARDEKLENKQHAERIWTIHRGRFAALRERQAAERAATSGRLMQERKEITFARAKAELMIERQGIPEIGVPPLQPEPQGPAAAAFNQAAQPEQISTEIDRAEQLRRDMEAWRRNNPDRDFGREL